jgi:hypothetical protein
MLKSTNKEMKTLLHNLTKVLKTGDDFHKELMENVPQDIEVFDGDVKVNLKVSLRERNPPCTLAFNYLQVTKRTPGEPKDKKGDLTVYVSRTCKDPNESSN